MQPASTPPADWLIILPVMLPLFGAALLLMLGRPVPHGHRGNGRCACRSALAISGCLLPRPGGRVRCR